MKVGRWLLGVAATAGLAVMVLEGRAAVQGESRPVSAESQRLFEQLIGSDPARRDEAYETLAKSDHRGLGALFPALEAYRDGLLERSADGRLVIYMPRVEIAGRKVFPLVDAWTLKPATKPDGSAFYAEGLGSVMLKPDETGREKLSQAIAALSIYQPDSDRRREAIVEAGNRADATLLDDLRSQLQTEPGGAISNALRESIARIELVKGTEDGRLAAVLTLGELGTSHGASDLRAALDTAHQENNGRLASEIEAALRRIDSYQKKILILQHTFAGLSLGSILVLLALGLSIIFGLMRVINLAHGEFMMVGAYTTYVVSEFFKTHFRPGVFDYFFFVALPLAFLVAGVVGWICEIIVIRHLYGRPIETLLATWGISLLLIQSARLLFGDTTSLTPPSWLQGGWEIAPDLVFPLNRVFIVLFCGFCVVAVYYLVQRTRFGLLLRATTQDRPIATALGVPARWIDGMTFGLGTGLAGLAGSTVPLFDKLNPNMGQGYVVDSFMVVVVGGVGKLAGAITAGMGLGFLTKYIEPWLQAVYGKLAVLGFIILFLQWRPSGLFPHRGRAED